MAKNKTAAKAKTATTLRSYVTRIGSQEAAAREIGVSLITVGRWLRKEDEPRGLSRRRLDDLGIGAIG